MPTYIAMGTFAQKGIENIKDSPKRLEDAKKLTKSLGGKILEFYYTMGRFDFVVICEAPSDEVMTKFLLMVAAVGAVRTETLSAIPADKGAELFKELP